MSTGCNISIERDVRHIIASLLVLQFKSVYPVGGPKCLYIVLCVVVDPEVVIEVKIKNVVDVMVDCFVEFFMMYF